MAPWAMSASPTPHQTCKMPAFVLSSQQRKLADSGRKIYFK